MGNKSVIQIAVDDVQFKAFYELYQQFEGKVGELPEEWNKVNDAATHSHEALAGAMGVMVDHMLEAKNHSRDLAQHLKEASEAQKQFRLTTGEGEVGLRKMKNEAKELAHTLFGIGKFLFKISVLGLGTAAGSLFGIDKLAQHAVANQRTARGLGLSTGQLRAFQTDIGSRYADDGMLERVANAKNDLLGQAYLRQALGLSQAQLDRTDPGSIAAQALIKAHDWWASTPSSQHNEAFYKSTLLEGVVPFELARQSGNTDRSELVRAYGQYKTDASSLTVNDRNTDALYSFTRQLDLAGQKLETVFTSRVAQLGPALGDLMETLGKNAEILVNDIFSKQNIDALAGGIDSLTRFLGSQEFKDDLHTFVVGMGKIASAIMSALKLLVPDSTGNGGPANADGTPIPKGTSYWDNPANSGGDTLVNKALHPGDYSAEREKLLGFIPYDKQVYRGAGFENINPATDKGRGNLAYLSGLEKTLGLPAGILSADVEAESGGNPFAVSKKGAKGAMQLMPSVISQYGVGNPFDFEENTRAGATNLARLYKFYNGDIRKALAASNWGEGNLNNEIKGYMDQAGLSHKGRGDDWESGAPDETKNHIKRVLDIMSRNRDQGQTVRIQVENKAGANYAISQNAGKG